MPTSFLETMSEALTYAAAALRHHPDNLGALRAAMACKHLAGNIEARAKIMATGCCALSI